MKLVTQEELAGHDAATMQGAIEGTLAGLVLAVPGSYLLHRRWAYYRSLPIQLKALGVVLIVAPTFAIQAERRGVQYDKSLWKGAGKDELDREQTVEENRWDEMGHWQKVGDWAHRHRYPLLFGCWVATMAGSWIAISRKNPWQPFSQRIVQARVYAQGATVATVLGAAMMTQTQQRDDLKQKNVDHSWAFLLEQQEKEAHQQKIPA